MLNSFADKQHLGHYQASNAIEYLKALVIILFVYMQIQRGLFRAGLPIGNEFIHLFDSILNTILIPLGFAITGWVFALASQQRSRLTNTLTLLDVVVYPYFLWAILQGFIQTQFNFLTQSNHSFIHIVSLLPIEPYGHFKNLYVAFFCAILCLLLIKQRSIFFIAIALAIAAAMYLARDTFKTIFIFYAIAPYLFFFVLGIGLSTAKEAIACASKFLGFISFIGFVFSQWLFHGIFKADPYVYSWQVLVVATVSIVCLFIFFSTIATLKSNISLAIGKSAFAIYLLHFLLVGGTRVLLIDLLSIENIWLNLGTAFFVAIAGGLCVYYFSQRLHAYFLWRPPQFFSAHTLTGKLQSLWQNKPASRPISIALALLLASPFIGVYALSEAKIKQRYTIETPPPIKLSTRPEDIANGKRLGSYLLYRSSCVSLIHDDFYTCQLIYPSAIASLSDKALVFDFAMARSR